MITVKTPVDREAYDSVTLTIRAEDSGDAPLSNFAQIFVTIEDVNDNRCATFSLLLIRVMILQGSECFPRILPGC